METTAEITKGAAAVSKYYPHLPGEEITKRLCGLIAALAERLERLERFEPVAAGINRKDDEAPEVLPTSRTKGEEAVEAINRRMADQHRCGIGGVFAEEVAAAIDGALAAQLAETGAVRAAFLERIKELTAANDALRAAVEKRDQQSKKEGESLANALAKITPDVVVRHDDGTSSFFLNRDNLIGIIRNSLTHPPANPV